MSDMDNMISIMEISGLPTGRGLMMLGNEERYVWTKDTR